MKSVDTYLEKLRQGWARRPCRAPTEKTKTQQHAHQTAPQQQLTTDNRAQAPKQRVLTIMVGRKVPGEREGRTSVEPAAPAPSSSSSSNSRFSSSPGARIFLVNKKSFQGILKKIMIRVCYGVVVYLMVAIYCMHENHLKGTGWTSNGNSLL